MRCVVVCVYVYFVFLCVGELLCIFLVFGVVVWPCLVIVLVKSFPVNNICITFVQCWTNVEDIGPTLYKCYADVLCLLGYISPPRTPCTCLSTNLGSVVSGFQWRANAGRFGPSLNQHFLFL